MDPAAVNVITQYLSEIHAKDAGFFKQLVSGAQVTGRLFFDLQVGGAMLNNQVGVADLMKSNASVAAAKNKSLDVVKDMQPTLNMDTISGLRDFSSRNFQEVVNSSAWSNITAGMDAAEVTKLQQILAGALTYKITSEAVNPHLTDPAIRGNMKLFTAIVNMPDAPEIILQKRMDEYKKSAISDPLSQTEANLINYINNKNQKSVSDTLNMLVNTVSGIGGRLEFKYLGENGKSILGAELGRLHSHLSNMDSKKALDVDQAALRDMALNKIEQIARDNNLSLSAPRPSLARGASSSPSSSPSSSRQKESDCYTNVRQRLNRSSPRSSLTSSTGAASAAAAAAATTTPAAAATTGDTPQQLKEERTRIERSRSPSGPRGGS